LLPGAHREPAVNPAGRRRGDPLAERERQHEPLVVVGVLAHQVGPPRGQPHAVRLAAEPLPEQRNRSHRGDRAWVNRQASAAMALTSRDARQPSSDWIFADEATSTAGSPARRDPTSTPMSIPVNSLHFNVTSSTEKPSPLPRL